MAAPEHVPVKVRDAIRRRERQIARAEAKVRAQLAYAKKREAAAAARARRARLRRVARAAHKLKRGFLRGLTLHYR